MTKLAKRRPLLSAYDRDLRLLGRAAKAFHAPQREKIKHPMPPRKPRSANG